MWREIAAGLAASPRLTCALEKIAKNEQKDKKRHRRGNKGTREKTSTDLNTQRAYGPPSPCRELMTGLGPLRASAKAMVMTNSWMTMRLMAALEEA